MSILKLTLSAIVLTFGFTGALLLDHGRQDSSLDQLEQLSGGDFCSDGGVKDGEEALGLTAAYKTQSFDDGSFSFEPDPWVYRMQVVRRFDTADTRCLDLSARVPGPRSGRRSRRRNAGSFDIDGRRVPLIISWLEADGIAEGSDESAQTIYIRVGGGPGGVNITRQLDAIIDYFEGDYLIDFYYTGHGFNTVHPNPSFDIAVAQLETFLEQLRTRNPASKIVVVGESLGAVLSLEALKDSKEMSRGAKPVADKLVLLSPPFGKLDRVKELLEELQIAHGVEGTNYLYRLRDAGQNYNDYGDLAELDGIDVFQTFYPEWQGTKNLAERVSNLNRSLPILVIYGDADVRIDLDEANTFASLEAGNVRVTRIGGMAHEPASLEQINSIRDELGYFVDD